MALMVNVNGTWLIALLDSGSTHNFIDNAMASRACVILAEWHSLCVTITNGEKLPSSGCCRNMAISVHGENFHINCFDLPLGSYDMVLGVQWLESLGPILWDFCRGTLAFVQNGHRVTWSVAAAGSTPTPPPSLFAMDKLLEELAPLFQEPAGLPLAHSRAHCIHLLPDTTPVAVHPYCYAHAQKVELKRQCAAMLHSVVIRPSSSAFSAPALLVKKFDDSWRFCVDYRTLNKQTVKDKFPIPVVEELLDPVSHVVWSRILAY
jgi:hypothetical protein